MHGGGFYENMVTESKACEHRFLHYGAFYFYRLEGVRALSSGRWICSRSGIEPSLNCRLDIFQKSDGGGFSHCIRFFMIKERCFLTVEQ